MTISKTAETGATNTAEALIGKAPETMHAAPSPTDARVSGTYGDLTVTYAHTDAGQTFTVTVEQRTLRIHELSQAFTTPAAAWAEAQRIATAGFAGTPLAQIIADRPATLVLTETARIVDNADVTPDTITALLADAMRRRDMREVNRLNQIADTFATNADRAMLADIADTMVLAEAQRIVDEAPRRTLADTAPTGDRLNTHRVAAEPTSAPMDRIITIAAEGNGRIVRGGHAEDGEANSKQLIALDRRGLVKLTYGVRRNQRVIAGGWLTAKGWKHAERLCAEVAA